MPATTRIRHYLNAREIKNPAYQVCRQISNSGIARMPCRASHQHFAHALLRSALALRSCPTALCVGIALMPYRAPRRHCSAEYYGPAGATNTTNWAPCGSSTTVVVILHPNDDFPLSRKTPPCLGMSFSYSSSEGRDYFGVHIETTTNAYK